MVQTKACICGVIEVKGERVYQQDVAAVVFMALYLRSPLPTWCNSFVIKTREYPLHHVLY